MPLSRASYQLPSTESRVIAAMVGRISKSPLCFPCLCEALGMSPHWSTCLGWQQAITVLSAFLQPGQGGMSISHQGISCVLCVGGPSRALPFKFRKGYAHGAVQSYHAPGDTTSVCVFHTATANSADLCKSRATPLKLVNLLWDKRGTAKEQLLPMEDEMLPTY